MNAQRGGAVESVALNLDEPASADRHVSIDERLRLLLRFALRGGTPSTYEQFDEFWKRVRPLIEAAANFDGSDELLRHFDAKSHVELVDLVDGSDTITNVSLGYSQACDPDPIVYEENLIACYVRDGYSLDGAKLLAIEQIQAEGAELLARFAENENGPGDAAYAARERREVAKFVETRRRMYPGFVPTFRPVRARSRESRPQRTRETSGERSPPRRTSAGEDDDPAEDADPEPVARVAEAAS
jgi:hypothetical protein